MRRFIMFGFSIGSRLIKVILVLGNLNRRNWNMIVENEEYYLDGKNFYIKKMIKIVSLIMNR